MMLAAHACYTMDHYNGAALPGMIHLAYDIASSTHKVRHTVEALDATLVTGHDLEEWSKSRKAPDYYA